MRLIESFRLVVKLAYLAFAIGILMDDTLTADFPYLLTAYFALISLARGAERFWAYWQWRLEVRALRRWDPADQAAFIANIAQARTRHEYRRRMAEHAGHEVEGATERFPFAPADRRSLNALFWWTVPLTALFALLALGALHPPRLLRWVLWSIAALGVGLLAWALRRLRLLSSVLEITPFGATIVWPAGARRHVPFHQSLVLRNRPWRARVDLESPTGRLLLPIHYDRVAVARALRLIRRFGGFEPSSGQE